MSPMGQYQRNLGLSEELGTLWDLKIRRKRDVFESRWALLWSGFDLRLPQEALDPEVLPGALQGIPEPELLTLLILTASHHRQEGRPEQAKRQMALISPFFAGMLQSKVRFFYCLEMSSLSFLYCQWLESFEWAQRAIENSFDDCSLALPLSTLLLAQENLGVIDSGSLTRLKSLLEKNQSNTDLIAVQELIESFELRQFFRQGDFSSLLIQRVEETPTHYWYTRIWIQQLPYLCFKDRVSKEAALNLLMNYPIPYFRKFLTDTVLGIWNQEDTSLLSLDDKIDRLYLWNWKWLATGDENELHNTLRQLNDIDFSRDLEKISVFSQFMLRSTLLWLALFDPQQEVSLRRLLERLKVPEREFFPLLHFETDVAECLLSRLQGRCDQAGRLLEHLRKHRLHSSRDLAYVDLLKEEPLPVDHPLHLLSCRWNGPEEDSMNPKIRIFVDLDLVRFQSRRIHSRLLARGLSCFIRRPALKMEEVATFAFELGSFDEATQSRRLYKLLRSMNDFCEGKIRFVVREGRVHSIGDSQLLEAHHSHTMDQRLPSHPEWKKFLGQGRDEEISARSHGSFEANRKRVLRLLSESRRSWSQKKIANHLQINRSTLLRILLSLREADEIVRVGAGSVTQYTVR